MATSLKITLRSMGEKRLGVVLAVGSRCAAEVSEFWLVVLGVGAVESQRFRPVPPALAFSSVVSGARPCAANRRMAHRLPRFATTRQTPNKAIAAG